eukprot:m.80867 g.80867  ORF g.80867 m.80867 type:complete len:239 (+) comp25357_c0_seq1:84-800(+)
MLSSLAIISSVTLGSWVPHTAPTIPAIFTSNVVESSSGTFPGVPQGTKSFLQFYDYEHQKLRKDYVQEGYSKIYRYDQKIDPPFPPAKGDPTFPSPKGYKLQLHGGVVDPNQCCWLWLVDDEGNPDTMFEQIISPKAVDAGATTKNGVPSEHYTFHTNLPFPQTNDYYFATADQALVQVDSYASIFKKGTVIGNSSFTNFTAAPIANTTFAVPTSDPTFGICKQCGVDPECPMQMCMD